MVQLVTGLSEPAPDVALRNRDAVVFFTDKILQQAQFTYEKQLVYALATEENPLRQRRLLMYQLEANRAMNLEDRLIDSLIREESGCSPSCRKKRSAFRTSSANTPFFFSDADSSRSWPKKETTGYRLKTPITRHLFRLAVFPVNRSHPPNQQTLTEAASCAQPLIV